MKTVEGLLTMFIAVTLALSVVSVANPLFFIGGLSAFADEDDNDNSGSGNRSDDEEHEEESEENEDNDNEEQEEQEVQEGDSDEQEYEVGENSLVELRVREVVELDIHIEEGDIEPKANLGQK